MSELIERLKAATGPDRELDCGAWGETEGWIVHEVGDHIIVADKPGEVQRVLGWADPGKVKRNASINATDIPAYTASVDAALELVERKLPGEPDMLYSYDFGWHASAHSHMAYTADLHVAVGNPPDMRSFHGQGYTLPLAILIALLTALASGAQP